MSLIVSACLVFIILHAVHMCHTVSCGMPGVTGFFTLSHKRQDFRKKKLPKTKCVFLFFLQRLSETFLILRRTERYVIGRCIDRHVTYTLFFSDLSLNFIDNFSKILISNFTKIRAVGAESSRADGQT